MGTTIKKISQSCLFKEIPLVAGLSGIDNRVDYVTICNSPILSLPNYDLDDYVLVITSFSVYYKSIDKMKAMIIVLSKQHGKSWPLPNNKVIAEFHQYGDFVWDCIQAMGLKNVMTAGCSMAGCIQYYIAQNYPVKAVCCMQGVEDTAGQTDTRITDMLWHPLVSCQHSHLELTESLIGEKTSQERLDFIYWGVMQETGITKQGDYLELLSFDVKDNMNKITCPVLIIEGMDDQSYTPYMTKLSKERLVNAEYVELDLIPGYGHFIAVESPESVYKYLNEFIDKHVLKVI